MVKYTTTFKEQILSDYKEHQFGYRKIAKKYGLTRDAVRGIILGSRQGRKSQIAEVDMKDEKIPEFKTAEEELEYYRIRAKFFRFYAEELEQHISDEVKKKVQSKLSVNVQNRKNR